MQGYKQINNPSFNEIVMAMSQCGYGAFFVGNCEGAVRKIGDAAYLHDLYNTLDEVAAIQYAKRLKLPEGTFSSRQQEDGSVSPYPEDVEKARLRRTPQQSKAINNLAWKMWARSGLNLGKGYPYTRVSNLGVQFVNAHHFLEDECGRIIQDADVRAEKSDVVPATGEPSANLIAWISAFFLITHKSYYTLLLDEWRNNIGENEELRPLDVKHPKIKSDFFRMLTAYFDYHMRHEDEASDNPYYYFEGTLNGFIENNMPNSIFFPNISEETYREAISTWVE